MIQINSTLYKMKCTKNVRQKSLIFGGAFFMSKYRVIFLLMI